MALRQLSLVILLTLLSSGMLAAADQTAQLADGTSVELKFFEPLVKTSPPPLVIFITDTSHNEFLSKAYYWLGEEFVERGWALAAPALADGALFSASDSNTLPQIIEHLHATQSLQDSKPLLVGISSGGTEAMAISFLNPSAYRGVVAIPGHIKPDTSIDELGSLPFYIRIGEKDDLRWNRMLEPMSQRLLTAGAEVDAEIIEDARHIFLPDWENLEAWLGKLK